jgi:hypothetical protein
MKKHFTAHIIFAATALASQQVWALGFGRAVSDAVLGQSFTFTVPVHGDPGERFGADCVAADVYYGESLLQPQSVRTEVERGKDDNSWLVRITARAPVEEPIVEVALSAGCERRFTRRFTVFADPPVLGATAAQLPQAAGDNRAVAAPPPPGAATATASAPQVVAASATPLARHRGNGAATGHARVLRKGPTMALANELNAPARPAPDTGNAHKPGPRVAAPPAATTPRLVLDGGYSHLKLDIEEPIIPAAASASGAAIALSDLDDPDARQMRALEQNIQAIRRDSQAARDQAAKLQVQLAEAQSRSDWMPWIFGLLALAVAAIAALAWKLRQQSKAHHSAWFNESQHSASMPLAPMPAPAVAATPPVAAPAFDLRENAPELADEDPVPTPPAPVVRHAAFVADVSATQPLDRRAMATLMAPESAPRELSVEELLDLEQQADFFIALGQEDAAVDLLMSHLRSAGGQSPLPYTKLLEIYRRQGDRSAYERTRARFNRRFNAYAPDWDTGPASGRTLEDYPDTIALLEGAWQSPIDAMAILEGLLFKRDDTSELFDLPAYRDVLVLYSLARDLWQQGGGSTGTQVDVLLPLDDVDAAQRVPFPSARQFNDLDPSTASDSGMLTSFEMTGFESGHGGGAVDLELPGEAASHAHEPLFNPSHDDDGVHATLDAMSLAPAAPVKRKPAPRDWEDSGAAPDSERPTKR